MSFAALALRVRAANDTTRAHKLLKNAGAQAIKESIEQAIKESTLSSELKNYRKMLKIVYKWAYHKVNLKNVYAGNRIIAKLTETQF